MSSPFIIFGAGGHGKVVLDAALAAKHDVAFVVDDAPHETELLGLSVLSSEDPRWLALTGFRFVVAVGDNLTRARIFARLNTRSGIAGNVIHPNAVISPFAKLGAGNVCFAGVVINPGTVMGDDCIINTSASIDHDCRIGSHAHICPGVHLAGTVSVGEETMIGTGAAILPGIKIGRRCVIGAGAVVNRDLPDGVVAYGVPARIRR
ncbi:MAG TPA: acetyltransferase [Candidatus Paceibacterota bacterium]|nr:acetyltransferase [Verrucomicrobiota bacterium]HRY50887.1 acetyltransferase [Candidatus Paceibacterota bacterium]HSA01697.1 acetyltransferase [Candidatus Paceibacterota bacterium]